MVKQKRYHQSSYAARGTAAICPIINSTQGIAMALCEAQHNAIALPCADYIMAGIAAALRE